MFTLLTISKLDSIFNQLRASAIGGSQNHVKIAFAIACMLVLIRLCKLAYDIISDEQHGGFGGVKLSDILIPICFLILIQGAPIAVGALDNVTGWVVGSVANSVVINDADQAFNDNMKALEEEYEKTLDAEIDQKVAQKETMIGKALKKWGADCIKDLKTAFFGSSTAIGARFIPWLCVKLFGILSVCYIVIANVFLCILAVCFPFTICLELCGIWNGNLKGFIVKYVQVSFWRVIIALIQWCIASVRIWASTGAVSEVIGSGMSSGDMCASIEASIWTAAIVCIAGIMCLAKVPEWATAVIGGGAGEASGGAGGVAGSMNGQPGRTTKAGIDAAKGIHGWRQGNRNAANMEKIAGSLMNK